MHGDQSKTTSPSVGDSHDGTIFKHRSKTRTKKDYAMKTLVGLAANIAKWSDKTFGTKEERGPLGPLKHLRKEVDEVIKDIEAENDPLEELADCLILLLDATRRSDFLARQLLEAAYIKMEKNRQRKWPKPTADGPVEHVREAHERPELVAFANYWLCQLALYHACTTGDCPHIEQQACAEALVTEFLAHSAADFCGFVGGTGKTLQE